MKLVFATHNQNKLKEVRALMPKHIEVLSLTDIKWHTEIDETSDTIEGNALLKAQTVFQQTKMPCFADDSGLLVNSLNGAPGVYSARYGGEQKNDQDNIRRLLHELHNITQREAHFKTVMALVLNNQSYLFEGIVYGKITTEKTGTNGFGYDPVFLPQGSLKTFAEMSAEEKNAMSHRAIAIKKMTDFLSEM
ncbi:MAG: non-canonical purine NTP diphosphatase [Bacteroidia bacterium]|nr:non-canonical purine NTP diphosphatase [Bacteroidia bacterium]